MKYEDVLFELTRLQKNGLTYLTAFRVVEAKFEEDFGMNFRDQLEHWQKEQHNNRTMKQPEAQLNEDLIEYSISATYKGRPKRQ
jgi:hypothetical protein